MVDGFILLVFYTYVFSIWYKVVLNTEFCPLKLEHITSTAGVIIFAKSHQVLDGTLETSNHCQITKVFILYVSHCDCINFRFDYHHGGQESSQAPTGDLWRGWTGCTMGPQLVRWAHSSGDCNHSASCRLTWSAIGARALKISMLWSKLVQRQELPTSAAQLGGKSRSIYWEPSWDNTAASYLRAPWERRPCAPWPGWAWSPQRRKRRPGGGRLRWGWRRRWRRRGRPSGWPLFVALAGREEADVMECEEEEQRIYSKKTIFMYVIKNPLISSLNIIS